jgi:hypothetical protein
VAYSNIICRSSDFFQAAIKGEWKDSQDKTVTLPETRPEIFGAYLGWLYTGQVDVKGNENVKYEQGMPDHERRKVSLNLIDAYRLGEYVHDHLFRNAVVDEMQALVNTTRIVLNAKKTAYFWDSVSHSSTLAKLMVDYWASDHDPGSFDNAVAHLPHDFLMEIAKIGVREKHMKDNSRRPRNRPMCYYHEHKDEADKCK